MKGVHAIGAIGAIGAIFGKRRAPAVSRVEDERRAPRARRARNVIDTACALLALASALLAPAPALLASPPALFAKALHAAPPASSSPTVQEVLAKSLAARGGATKLHAIATRREVGTLGLGPGNEWPFVVEHRRPNLMRMEIELQGTKLIRAFDGTRGWQKQPQAPAPEQLTGDDLHNIANEADFDNVLVDTDAKGKAELLGKESIGGAPGRGAPGGGAASGGAASGGAAGGGAGSGGAAGGRLAYKVQITLKSGDVFYYYIDAASYLPIHWEGSRMISGRPVLFESDFNDYRESGGVKYPFQIVSSIKGSAQKQKITFTKIEINPPLDDARFTPASMAAPPAAAPAPTPPAAAPPAASAPTPPPAATTPPPATPPPASGPVPAKPPATPPPPAATTPPPSPPPAGVTRS
jgi:hypothetical protein